MHCKMREGLRGDDMANEIKAKVLKMVSDDLKGCEWEIPEDFFTFEHFKRVVAKLDLKSSPGYPYLLQCPSNREFFQADSLGNIPAISMMRIWCMVQAQVKDRKADPIRLFIKPEPHSQRKMKAGRYRLISSVSIIDQIIDHMLFDNMNEKLIENCHSTPVKTGWTPILGGWKEVPISGLHSTDKTCFDWTVQGWMLENELAIRKIKCKNLTKLWEELAEWRYTELFHRPVFVTSGGHLLRQKFIGIMKSGCVNTIATNSIIQLILHRRVAVELDLEIPFIWVMGDDVIQTRMDRQFYDLLSQFIILKELSTHIEFAGYRFSRYRVDPLYFGKHAFMLLNQKEQFFQEMADSYMLLYHRSGRSTMMRELLSDLSSDVVSEQILDVLWDSA